MEKNIQELEGLDTVLPQFCPWCLLKRARTVVLMGAKDLKLEEVTGDLRAWTGALFHGLLSNELTSKVIWENLLLFTDDAHTGVDHHQGHQIYPPETHFGPTVPPGSLWWTGSQRCPEPPDLANLARSRPIPVHDHRQTLALGRQETWKQQIKHFWYLPFSVKEELIIHLKPSVEPKIQAKIINSC